VSTISVIETPRFLRYASDVWGGRTNVSRSWISSRLILNPAMSYWTQRPCARRANWSRSPGAMAGQRQGLAEASCGGPAQGHAAL